jgi:Bacterial PH domain
MAIRDKLSKNATPLLQPGESIQSIFCAQTVSAYFALISIWIIVFSNAYRVIVVTDRRILVCRSGRFTMTPVKTVETEVPRATRLGEPNGLWWPCDSFGRRLYIHKRFHKDVRQADATLTAA